MSGLPLPLGDVGLEKTHGGEGMPRLTSETIRQLAQAAGIRPDEAHLDGLAQSLSAIIEAVEHCEELGLSSYEPTTILRLDARTDDEHR